MNTSVYKSQAYATVIHGDGPHACGAAVLGQVLQEIDSRRPRAIIAINVSAETQELLSDSGLWQLHVYADMEYNWRFWGQKNAYLEPSSRKAALWDLPFERVLFFDSDHLPLPSSTAAQRLQALWNLEGPIVAAVNAAQGIRDPCFNGGLLLLHPDPKVARQYKELVKARQRTHNFPCRPDDQAFLNKLFPIWTRIERNVWRIMTTAHDDGKRATQHQVVRLLVLQTASTILGLERLGPRNTEDVHVTGCLVAATAAKC
eukprot:CAMPEP_0119346122 /NCGR_PEP_ID=MMETSP1333-20130426/107844_1 /TAXON_ID=418940 /ORGANISM="Scyphosphaera apsteinii, Strain RCC1455" /LENGTH=258 /DNA_ID=CAMNT_0007358621 /DNA_START=854 /DNA_END=1631 /DNA_ORIENTATION=-